MRWETRCGVGHKISTARICLVQARYTFDAVLIPGMERQQRSRQLCTSVVADVISGYHARCVCVMADADGSCG